MNCSSIPTYETSLAFTLDGSLSVPSNEDKSVIFNFSGVGTEKLEKSLSISDFGV